MGKTGWVGGELSVALPAWFAGKDAGVFYSEAEWTGNILQWDRLVIF